MPCGLDPVGFCGILWNTTGRICRKYFLFSCIWGIYVHTMGYYRQDLSETFSFFLKSKLHQWVRKCPRKPCFLKLSSSHNRMEKRKYPTTKWTWPKNDAFRKPAVTCPPDNYANMRSSGRSALSSSDRGYRFSKEPESDPCSLGKQKVQVCLWSWKDEIILSVDIAVR